MQIVFALKILCAALMARWSMQMLTAHCVRDAPRRCLRCRIGDNPDELVALAFARRAGFCHVANGVQCGTFFGMERHSRGSVTLQNCTKRSFDVPS